MLDFQGQNILEFTERFKDEQSCLSYLANLKWQKGFVCKKCNHTKFTIRKANQARDCNRCHHVESPTAGTLFHRTKFGLRKAFTIIFEMTATTKGISSSQAAERYSLSRTTTWTFMQKVRIAMKSTESQPIENEVQVDEFVIGGKEDNKQGRSYDSKKKKVVAAVELTAQGNVKRAYFKSIENYSSKSLMTIFDAHIATTATVCIDQWTGCRPIKEIYNIEAEKSNKGQSMKQMHVIIHKLIERMIVSNPTYYQQIKLSK